MKLIQVCTCASRSRNPMNPTKDRGKCNGNFVQFLEVGTTRFSNAITSVSKDSYILEIYG